MQYQFIILAVCTVAAESVGWLSWFGRTSSGSSGSFLGKTNALPQAQVPMRSSTDLLSLNLDELKVVPNSVKQNMNMSGMKDNMTIETMEQKVTNVTADMQKKFNMNSTAEVAEKSSGVTKASATAEMQKKLQLDVVGTAAVPVKKNMSARERVLASKPNMEASAVELKKYHKSWEASLISNIATGEDEHAQPCIAHCRYGEDERHTWTECIERCVEDGLTKRMLLAGLPKNDHAAVHKDTDVPPCIAELKKKKVKKSRAEEL